jgi:hypothetical protein
LRVRFKWNEIRENAATENALQRNLSKPIAAINSNPKRSTNVTPPSTNVEREIDIERDRERWREMERDGERWREMEREIDRDGEREI